VWGGEEECLSAEQWVFFPNQGKCNIFLCHLSVQYTAWFLEVVFSAVRTFTRHCNTWSLRGREE